MRNRSELRRRCGLTQSVLAQRTGIAAPLICRWERGEYTLRPEQVEAIQRILAAELTRWLRDIAAEGV